MDFESISDELDKQLLMYEKIESPVTLIESGPSKKRFSFKKWCFQSRGARCDN